MTCLHANVTVALGFLFPSFDCRVLSTFVRPVRPFTVEAFWMTVLIVRWRELGGLLIGGEHRVRRLVPTGSIILDELFEWRSGVLEGVGLVVIRFEWR